METAIDDFVQSRGEAIKRILRSFFFIIISFLSAVSIL